MKRKIQFQVLTIVLTGTGAIAQQFEWSTSSEYVGAANSFSGATDIA